MVLITDFAARSIRAAFKYEAAAHRSPVVSANALYTAILRSIPAELSPPALAHAHRDRNLVASSRFTLLLVLHRLHDVEVATRRRARRLHKLVRM